MANAALAWAEWLREKRWNVWATVAFGAGQCNISEQRAHQHIVEWLQTLEVIRREVYQAYPQPGFREDRPRVYAAYVIEWGPLQGRIHAHLLIGGLGGHPGVERRATAAWRRGPIYLVRYNPALDPKGSAMRGASAYLRKHPDTEIQIYGHLKKWRPRVARNLR